MSSKIKILHLEDSAADAELVDYELKKGHIDFDKRVVDNQLQYEEMLTQFNPDIVLSDHSLPSFNSFMALEILKQKKLDIPFILVTATVSEEYAVEIMRYGATDYILKDRLQRLPSALLNSIEKNLLEKERLAAHERLSFHMENAPLGFIEWDERGFAKSVSGQAENILGWEAKEFIKTQEKPFWPVYEEDVAWVDKVMKQLTSGEMERNKMQYRTRKAAGKVIWCEWFNSVLKDENGQVKTIMSLVQDISEQKQAEQEKDNFLSIASHELNTPVTTIKAYGQLAAEVLAAKGDTESLFLIRKMGAQIDKLTLLIGTLLDFTKIKNGQLDYDEDFFDFTETVKEVIDDMQKTSPLHQLINIPGPQVTLYGDKNKITQVLTNLLANAIKYSPDAHEVIINTFLTQTGIQLSVRDFGIGILRENQQHVFKQFYRVTGEGQSTFPGMGIGLYISSEIIKRHSGKIWVDSCVGKGSTFHIRLPFDHRKEPLPEKEIHDMIAFPAIGGEQTKLFFS